MVVVEDIGQVYGDHTKPGHSVGEISRDHRVWTGMTEPVALANAANWRTACSAEWIAIRL